VRELRGTPRPSTTKPPSARQVYAIAHGFCERYGERWPESRAEASELIRALRGEDDEDEEA
jgi:hypothetical protein